MFANVVTAPRRRLRRPAASSRNNTAYPEPEYDILRQA